MKYLLGVDAGNTKTIAVIATIHGEVVGIGRAGCGDHAADMHAMTHVGEAINRALQGFDGKSVDRADIEFAVFSMAGADFPEDTAQIEQQIAASDIVHGKFAVINDAMGALFAGSSTGFGIAIAADTFANTAARHDVRGIAREWCNGHFQTLGGGTALGTRAYEAVLAAACGMGEETSLTKALLDATNFFSVDDLMYERARRTHRAKPLKEFAEVVLNEAAAGDPVAMRIVEQEAETLASFAKMAALKVGLVRHVPIVLAGGVFNHSSDLLPKLIELKMQEKLPSCRVEVCSTPPVAGAVMRAFELNGGGSSMFIRQTLQRTLSERLNARKS